MEDKYYLKNNDGYDSNDNEEEKCHNTLISCNLNKINEVSIIRQLISNVWPEQEEDTFREWPAYYYKFLHKLRSFSDREMNIVQLINNSTFHNLFRFWCKLVEVMFKAKLKGLVYFRTTRYNPTSVIRLLPYTK